LVNAAIYYYYYRYKHFRKVVKNLLQNNDIVTAKTILSSTLTEHDNYMNSSEIPNDGISFTSIDNRTLRHGKLHSETSDVEPNQKQAAIDALNEGL